MGYLINYACISHIGKIRSVNQDNFLCDGHYMQLTDDQTEFPLCGTKTADENAIFGVFDGMGGEECGEVASYIASQKAADVVIVGDPTDELLELCQSANSEICAYAAKNEISAMGTTGAMLAFTPKAVTLCNIGDSKIFRLCDEQLEQISKDHLAVAAYGMKPPLSQNLGIPPEEMLIDPYLAQGAYQNKDRYLICSDGLTDMVIRDEIGELLQISDLSECVSTLVSRAMENGGKDNITVIVLEIQREENKLIQFFKRIGGKK